MCMTTKQREFVESIERNTKGLSAVSTGICPGCEQCRTEYGVRIDGREPTMAEFEEQWSTQEALCEPYFSWARCELCGSPLGGNREPWHAIDDATGKIIHGDHCCVDCTLYLANGDLPA